MTATATTTLVHRGGCLCAAVRYQITGEPRYAGYCCCDSCRKASASAFVPFMGIAASQFALTGVTQAFYSSSDRGPLARRNFCPSCGSLVHGGEIGVDTDFTVYAGTLDDVTWFTPQFAIFTKNLPDWVILPAGLHRFEGMPSQ